MLLARLVGRHRLTVLNQFAERYSRTYSIAIIKSTYEEIEVPDQTLTQFVWSRSSKWEDLPVMTCGVSGRSYTYGLAKVLYKQAAMAFSDRVGLKHGDTVGLILPNIPEFMLAAYASMDAGLRVTFANPLYTVQELQRQFLHANVKCIVTIPLLLENALAIATALPGYACTLNVGGQSNSDRKILGMEDLLSQEYDIPLPHVKSTDVAILPYSSGTTGMPKGVMLTHRNLVANILQVSHPELTDVREQTRENQEQILSVLPFFHIMGFNAIMNFVLYHGAHLISIPRFIPEDYIECLRKYRPSTLFVVPSLLLFLATHPAITAEEHLGSVKRITCGAAPATKKLIDKVYKKINRDDCRIEQGYGMTETGPVTLYTPKVTPHSKAGSCGKLLPSTEGRLIDLKSGDDIATPHVSGELLLRGPQIMKGYLNEPAATAEAIDSDGWLHTGDVGYFDEDYYFYIVDRTKELIKVKGNQVSPTELESLILEIPEVSDVAVVGIPDKVAGELPKAFIVKKPNTDIAAKDIEQYIAPKIAAYKRLAGGISFIKEIPRNPAGKILRHELRNLQD